MYRPYFMRVCGRDFNVASIISIEICEAIAPDSSVCTVEYNNKSITYPIKGTVQENQDKLTRAWRNLKTCDYTYMVDSGIERR